MKHMTRTFLLFVLLGLTAGSCKKDDDNNDNPEDSLAEYFYCKINGQEFRPSSTFGCNNRLFGYYPEAGDGIEAGYLVLNGTDCPTFRSMSLRFWGFEPNTETIDFVNPYYADSCSPIFVNYSETELDLIFDSLISGHTNFTHFCSSQLPNGPLGLVEGNFAFAAANSETDSIIHITDGHFRFRIQQTW